jgi:hypothetical protein
MFAMIVGEFEPGRLRRVMRSWRPAGGWKLYEQGRHRRSRSVTFLVSAPEVDSGFYAVAATLVPSAVWVSASGVSRVTPWPVRGSSNAIADARPELDGRWARILPTPGGETKGHAQLVLRRDP